MSCDAVTGGACSGSAGGDGPDDRTVQRAIGLLQPAFQLVVDDDRTEVLPRHRPSVGRPEPVIARVVVRRIAQLGQCVLGELGELHRAAPRAHILSHVVVGSFVDDVVDRDDARRQRFSFVEGVPTVGVADGGLTAVTE